MLFHRLAEDVRWAGVALTASGRNLTTSIPKAIVHAGILCEGLGAADEDSSCNNSAIVLCRRHAAQESAECDAGSSQQELRRDPAHENRAWKHADCVSNDCDKLEFGPALQEITYKSTAQHGSNLRSRNQFLFAVQGDAHYRSCFGPMVCQMDRLRKGVLTRNVTK